MHGGLVSAWHHPFRFPSALMSMERSLNLHLLLPTPLTLLATRRRCIPSYACNAISSGGVGHGRYKEGALPKYSVSEPCNSATQSLLSSSSRPLLCTLPQVQALALRKDVSPRPCSHSLRSSVIQGVATNPRANATSIPRPDACRSSMNVRSSGSGPLNARDAARVLSCASTVRLFAHFSNSC
jgi:hypothetical protein